MKPRRYLWVIERRDPGKEWTAPTNSAYSARRLARLGWRILRPRCRCQSSRKFRIVKYVPEVRR